MVFYRTGSNKIVRYLLWMLVATLAVLAFGGRALAATSETANEHDSSSVAVSNSSSQPGTNSVNVENYSIKVNDSSFTGTSTGLGSSGTSAYADNTSNSVLVGTAASGDSSGKKGTSLSANEDSVLSGASQAQAANAGQNSSPVVNSFATQGKHFVAWQNGSDKTPLKTSSITNTSTSLATPATAGTPINQSAPSTTDLGLVLNAMAGVLQNSSLGQIAPLLILPQATAINTPIVAGLLLAVALFIALGVLSLLIQLWRKDGFVHAARAGLGNNTFPIRYFVESLQEDLHKFASSLLFTYFVQNKKISVMCNTNLQGGAL